MKRWVGAAIAVVVLIALAVGGYYLVPMLASQQSENTVQFEKFGLAVMPGQQFTTTVGELGVTQLPATFAEDELTPEERVVASLIRDRNALIEENQLLKLKLEKLEAQVATLENYRDTNERYAPEQFDLELARVRQELEQRLRSLPEAEQYSSLMIQLMAIAGQQEYIHVVRTYDLILDDARKAIVIQRYLPTYTFCVANALSVAANTNAELRSVAAWLQEPDLNPLPQALKADLDVVLPPCQQSFREALDGVMKGTISG